MSETTLLRKLVYNNRSRGDKTMTFHDSPTDIPDPEVVPKAKRRIA